MRRIRAEEFVLSHSHSLISSSPLIVWNYNYIMKLSVAIIAAGLTITEAAGASSSEWTSLRRRLSYEKIAGYNPGSQVRLLLLC